MIGEERETIEPRLLGVAELSVYISMARETIYSNMKRGRFPANCVRRLGRKLLFEKALVDAHISAQPGAPVPVPASAETPHPAASA